ncbi:hypothetical protein M422DRAFT_47137 [Sphaerobolus stellatus SS14]|uniref:Ubiquitin-like domain-containing protein n=1 Tax=Sphaerobolus stellatus (strain SS14) TaxID=990650 RepID=A0A0C9W179_SPHS4|nr:hypothetical protein M422DRAFT_47137 [Sphaerobolus stellatus SS14]
MSIIVRGVGQRDAVIRVWEHDTIETILQILRDRHLIPSVCSSTEHLIYYDNLQAAPLSRRFNLKELGVGELSVLQLRTRVRGGTGRLSNILGTSSRQNHANRVDTGDPGASAFPSQHPERWAHSKTKPDCWECLVCQNGDPYEFVSIRRHEERKSHKMRLNEWLQELKVCQSNLTKVHRQAHGKLAGILSNLQQPSMSYKALPARNLPSNDWMPTIDYGAPGMDFEYDVDMHRDADELAQEKMASEWRGFYVDEGGFELDSDAEDCERDVVEDEIIGFGEGTQLVTEDVGTSRPRQTLEVGMDKEWFPWPDKETYIVDVLRHIPRIAFSDAQFKTVLWAFGVLSVSDVPSISVGKEIDKALQASCGIETWRYQGKLGHIYYANDLAGIIAQVAWFYLVSMEIANPKVRPHLHFYPEICGSHVAEARHAQRWLNEVDDTLLTPMTHVGSQDFYIFEPTLAMHKRILMPHHYFIREGNIDIPDPRDIIGVCLPGSAGLYPWWRMNPAVGNEWRARAKGCKVLSFPIWLYCDDTPGNLSKKWNKHNSFLLTAAGLPRKHVQMEYNVHFLSTSNIAPPLEMMDGIVTQLDEMACHRGLMVKFFCRICWVKGHHSADSDIQKGTKLKASQAVQLVHSDAASEISMTSEASGSGQETRLKSRRRPLETFQEMVDHVERFMEKARLRNRWESQKHLQDIFNEATCISGKKNGDQLVQMLNYLFMAYILLGLDPHADTPVEILHIILLGFVKYFWRDAVSCLKDDQKPLVIAHLGSVNVDGLGIGPIDGKTLIAYAGSLTGCDFRVLAQVAPFCLYDLVPAECLNAWLALGRLIPLWLMSEAIDHFLDCTAAWTPRWFNKPKFHIILHLPEHICRFGPASLFATEGFESFNAVIRKFSIPSNHQAPSRDIERGMARGNRLCHMLSGGFFLPKFKEEEWFDQCNNDSSKRQPPSEGWCKIASAPEYMSKIRNFAPEMFRIAEDMTEDTHRGQHCKKLSKLKQWSKTLAANAKNMTQHSPDSSVNYRDAGVAFLQNADKCHPGSWVICQSKDANGKKYTYIAQVTEILQSSDLNAEQEQKAEFLVVQYGDVSQSHPTYKMQHLHATGLSYFIPFEASCLTLST